MTPHGACKEAGDRVSRGKDWAHKIAVLFHAESSTVPEAACSQATDSGTWVEPRLHNPGHLPVPLTLAVATVWIVV